MVEDHLNMVCTYKWSVENLDEKLNAFVHLSLVCFKDTQQMDQYTEPGKALVWAAHLSSVDPHPAEPIKRRPTIELFVPRGTSRYVVPPIAYPTTILHQYIRHNEPLPLFVNYVVHSVISSDTPLKGTCVNTAFSDDWKLSGT